MHAATLLAAARGAGAAILAGVVQVAVGKTEERLLLPPGEDANLAPRLVQRLAEDVGERVPEPIRWAVGTAFHVGYSVAWGAAFGIAQRHRRVDPLLGGAALDVLIYGITFPRWGIAVQTDTERPPHRRSRRMTFVAASVAMTFGLVTGALYERLGPR